MSTEQNKSAKLEEAGGEWQEKTFSQLGKIVTGKTPPSAVSGFFGGNIPFVTPTDFDERRFISSTKRYLTEKGADSINSSRIPNMAIMISCIGSDMGKVAISETECFTNQQINSIIVEPDNNPIFIYYNLSNRKLEIRSVAGGSAQPILNKSAFGELNIILPPLEEQRAIAHILGTLDDKIELNQRTNETLEAMAQALFKFWFVDFGPVRAKMEGRWRRGQSLPGLPAHLFDLFPDRLVDSELGEIPEGWEVGKLGDIAEIINGFAFKSKDYVDNGIFVLRTKNFADSGFVERLSDDVYLPESFLKSHSNCICEEFDFFLVMVGASVGKVSTLYSNCLPALRNQNMWCFRPKTGFENRFYINNAVMQIIQLNSQIASGSARDFFRKEDFKKFKILIPTQSILKYFENIIISNYQKISIIHQEIDLISALRDTLLPKLISGKLRVKQTREEQHNGD